MKKWLILRQGYIFDVLFLWIEPSVYQMISAWVTDPEFYDLLYGIPILYGF